MKKWLRRRDALRGVLSASQGSKWVGASSPPPGSAVTDATCERRYFTWSDMRIRGSYNVPIGLAIAPLGGQSPTLPLLQCSYLNLTIRIWGGGGLATIKCAWQLLAQKGFVPISAVGFGWQSPLLNTFTGIHVVYLSSPLPSLRNAAPKSEVIQRGLYYGRLMLQCKVCMSNTETYIRS